MKRSLKTILLLAVLIALFAGYKLVGSLNEKSQVAEEAGTFTLTDKTAEDFGSVEEACEIMAQGPDWADGLPLRADGYSCVSYRKM